MTLHCPFRSDWSTLDGELKGNRPRGRSYRLREVPTANGEGDFFRMVWNGEIPEWNMFGYSYLFKENKPNVNGAEGTTINVNFHVGRKYWYYWYKALVPLYLLSATSLTVSTLDPQVARQPCTHTSTHCHNMPPNILHKHTPALFGNGNSWQLAPASGSEERSAAGD